MKEFDVWFTDNVKHPRFINILKWAQLLQILYAFIFFIIAWLVSFLPGIDITEASPFAFNKSTLFLYIFLLIPINIVHLIHFQNWFLVPKIFSTRISTFLHFTSPIKLFFLALFGASGGLTAYVFLRLIEYPNLVQEKSVDGATFFVIFAGLFYGLLIGCIYFFQQHGFVQFPILEQSSVFSMKFKIKNQLKESFKFPLSYRYLIWFCLAFYFFGLSLKAKVNLYFGYSQSSQPETDMWTLILDPNLLILTLITVAFIHFSWFSFFHLFQEITTKREEFSIEAEGTQPKYQCLQEALPSTDEYIKFMALADLKQIATSSSPRRIKIFDVTLPGGNSKHWIPMSDFCVSLITSFLALIDVEKPTCPPPVYCPNDLIANVHKSNPGLKNMVHVSESRVVDEKKATTFEKFRKNISNQIYSYLQERRIFRFFFNPLPESKSNQAFATVQPLNWAIESLCFLISASFTEDKYGIVQRNLAEVLSAILKLHITLDKQSGSQFGRRPYKSENNNVPKVIQLKQGLRASLNTGLYLITQTFGTNVLTGVQLPEEYRQILRDYLAFKA